MSTATFYGDEATVNAAVSDAMSLHDMNLRNREFSIQMLNLGTFPVELRTSAFVGLEPFDRDALDELALGAGAEFVGDQCAQCTALHCTASAADI